MHLSRILFTGDAFRTLAGESGQLSNVQWLQRTLGPLLHDLTGLPTTIAFPLAGGDVPSFVALQRGAMGLDGWARLFASAPTPELTAALREACGQALVVSIEMPPVLEAALDQAGVPWIDVGVSPLRFLPDWALHVRASAQFDLGAVSGLALSADDIAQAVRRLEAWSAPVDLAGPTLVFFAQTERDRTLITADGGFCGPDDALKAIAPLREGRTLLVKPHPWQAETPVVQALIDAGAEATAVNSYALLAHPDVEVVTLSSSVGREAKAFGRRTTIANPWVQDFAYGGVDVLKHSQSAAFWGALLASAGVKVDPGAAGPPWTPNGLRGEFGGQGLDPAVWA